MEKLNIRAMMTEDVRAVCAIEEASFSDPWSENTFLDTLSDINNRIYVAEIDGQVVGYINLWCVLDEGTVANIAVDMKYRQQGVAAALMEYAISVLLEMNMSAVTLEVRKSNAPAIKLYEKFGFESAGIRPNYYEKPREDAVIMWKYFH